MKRILFFILLICISKSLQASIITVTNTNDTGAGSLRDAIANAINGDQIRFDPTLISSGSATIMLTYPLNVDKGLFITGLYNATDSLIISGQGTSQIFDVDLTNATFDRLELDSMVLINGNGANGGAIGIDDMPNLGLLKISNSVIRNCSTAGNGGAIYVNRPYQLLVLFDPSDVTVEINNCNISNNTAGNSGGAIYVFTYSQNNYGHNHVNVTNSTISNNHANTHGGAIFSWAYSTTLDFGLNANNNVSIYYSTLDHNSAGVNGGAIYAYSSTHASAGENDARCTVDVYYSTLAYNSAVNSGGAIFGRTWGVNYVYHSNINVYYSTVVYNTANISGAAIYNESNDVNGFYAADRFKSTICAMNTGCSTNIYSNSGSNSQFSNGYNIFSTFPGTYHTTDQAGATAGTILLGPLQNNGGLTQTMMPGDLSIAVNLGDPLTTNPAQNRAILVRRDIGACESSVCNTPIQTDFGTVSICQGNSYDLKGLTLTTSGTYSQTVVDPLGCDSVFTVNLVVAPLTSTINEFICQGTSYDFHGTMLNTTGTYTYNTVNMNGCDSIVTLNLTVLNNLTPEVSITSDLGTSVCTAATVTFTATPTFGGSAPIYQWKKNGNNAGGGLSTYTTSTLADGDVITCEMTSNASCASPTLAISPALNMSVLPTVTPTLSITSNAGTTVCLGEAVTFSSVASNQGTNPNYQWKVNGVNAGSNSPTFTTSSLTNGAIVSCTMTSNASCLSSSTASSNTIPMTVVTATVFISQNGNTLMATSGFVSYQWSLNGNPISGATSDTYNPTENGNYSVDITDMNGCTDDYSYQFNFVGLEELDLTSVVLYPNPVDKILTIELPKTELGIREIEIYNTLGALIYTQKVSDLQEEINVQKFANGVYHVKLIGTEGEKGSLRFVKMD